MQMNFIDTIERALIMNGVHPCRRADVQLKIEGSPYPAGWNRKDGELAVLEMAFLE
jgi:hypothetical protein